MAELAARSPHDPKVVGSNPAGSKKSDLTKLKRERERERKRGRERGRERLSLIV